MARAGANRLAISGIVYNEMKGAFSDPDASLARLLNHGLLPDTIYAHESGGTPDAIPDLTYEAFRRFHADYYHPSNAYFFAYGDIATAEYCGFLDRRLAGFTRRAVTWPAGIAGDRFEPIRQHRWPAPRALRERYPIGSGEPAAERTYLINAWLTGDALDPVDGALMRVLSLILAGNEAAPLRRAVVAIGARRRPDLLRELLGRPRGHLRDRHPRQRGGSFRPVRGADRHHPCATLPAGGISRPRWWKPHSARRRSSTWKCSRCFPCIPCSGSSGAGSTAPTRCAFCASAPTWTPAGNDGGGSRTCSARLLRERLIDNPHRLNVVMSPDRAMQGELEARLQTPRRANRERHERGTGCRRSRGPRRSWEQLNSTPNTPEQLASLPQLQVSDLPGRAAARRYRGGRRRRHHPCCATTCLPTA